MPYVSISVSKTLDDSQKDALKSGMGQVITMIPGKTEEVTMVRIEDGCALWKGGSALESGAFVEVRLYGKAPMADKQRFTEAAFSMLENKAGISPKETYLNILEMDSWGSGGRLK
jgi:phenylpyruvate tautomerase PptA (4-oxalocrotonate tautomerase family)